jgi:hypothetical protein
MAVNATPHKSGEADATPTRHDLRRADDLVRRGTEQMRSQPAAGWFDVVERVTDAVRSAGRRGVEIDAAWPDHESARTADRLRISDLVVVDALRRALVAVPQCQPSAVDLMVVEEPEGAVRCRGARVSLVAAFDVDLHAVAAQARRLTLDTLTDVLGPPPDGLSRDAVVDVEIVDVTLHDPRR